jgi:serine/threonine-protein kinase HipA
MVKRACPICLLRSDGKEHPACSLALYGAASPPKLDVGLADVERLAIETVNRRLALTGVQRKLSLSFAGSDADRRLTIVGALGGSHILKPPAPEYPGMPELEHWTMALARASGLRTAEAGLLRLSSGEPAFITRRFDRDGARRIHVEDLCQLSGLATEHKYRSSMEKVGKLVRDLATAPGDDALRLLEVTVFAFLTGNSDMHLKNWTLVRDAGRVVLSPAYDLLPVRLLVDDPEEFALPINGRKNRLERRDFAALGQHIKIPDVVVRRTLDSLPARLLTTVQELPSPWVAREQARAFKALVAMNAARLADGGDGRRSRAAATKQPAKRKLRPRRPPSTRQSEVVGRQAGRPPVGVRHRLLRR